MMLGKTIGVSIPTTEMLGNDKAVAQAYILILISKKVRIPDWSSGGRWEK